MVSGLLVAIGGWISIVARTDRKRTARKAERGEAELEWTITGLPISIPTSVGEALSLARVAMTRVGARDVDIVDDKYVVGWIGSPGTNVPRFAAYQLGISVASMGDGFTLLRCSSRPRSPMAYGGHKQSQSYASRLVNEVGELAVRGHHRS
jgi:hypothetical protein